MSSFNFKDNLSIDNNKFLKFLDPSGLTKNNIIGLDTASNLYINSANTGDVYFNSNNSKSNTFININNSFGNTFISSKLAVGINTTSNINSNITLPINGFIGLNSTQGTHSGFLGLSGSSSLLNTSGSRMLLYGNDNISGGQIKLYAGNNTLGNINIYTGNDSLKMQILNNGSVNFQPDGSTIRLAINDTITTISNKVIISSTEANTGPNTGSLQIAGGLSVAGNTYVNGTLNVNGVSGNISFTSSSESTSYTSGATYLIGGLGIQCSSDSSSETAGGALSVAGGFALGKSAKIGGNITIYNSTNSTSALNGSGIFYGGVGINGQVNIRSNNVSQIKLIPVNTGNETSLFFGSQNNYTTSGSWIIGQNVNSIGASTFGIYNPNTGNYITLKNTQIYLEKYTNINDTLNFNANINDLLTIQYNSSLKWSIGRNVSDGNFQISRFNSGVFTNYLLTADTMTGNVTILGTENSTSSISGGSLTISGGTSIKKNLHVGGDIISGNVNFTGSLTSSSSNDVNSFSYLTLTSTDESLSITSGSLVSIGGISIQCTTDVVSSTNGGGLSVAGGVGIGKSLIVNETVSSLVIRTTNITAVNCTTTNHFTTNITSNNLLTTNLSVSNLSSISQTLGSLKNTNLVSTNSSIASLYTIDINSLNITTSNANITNAIINNINSTNNTFANTLISNSTITSSIITNLSSNNSVLTFASIGSLVVNTTANLRFNSNTLGSLFTTGGNVGIGITNPETKLVINSSGDTYLKIKSPAANIAGIQLVGGLQGIHYLYQDDFTSLFKIDYDTLNLLSITTTGNIGINTTTPIYNMDVNGTFRTQSTSLIGDINNISNTVGSNNFSSDIALSNSTRNSIIFNKAGLNAPTFTSRSIGTKLNLYPNISSSNMDYSIGIETNSMWYSAPSFKWYSNVTSANMILTNSGLGINTNNLTPNFALEVIGAGKISSSLSALGNSNTLGNLYTTGGNVGINTTIPSYTLDVNGTGRFSTSFNANGNSNTIGNLFTTGGNIGVQNTSPNQRLEVSSINYAANQDGGLRVSTRDYISINDPSYRYIDIRLKSDPSSNYRGSVVGTLSGGIPTEYEYMSFSQNGFTNIYSHTEFVDNTSCSNSSTGSVVLSGGLSINCPTNATSVLNGGALTVHGGAAIEGNLIIGGTIIYSNSAAASSTFAYLTLTSTDFSTDVANGSLITFGGISVQCTAEAYSSTQGNALTIAGGMGIGSNLYVGTIAHIPSVISTNNSCNNSVLTNASIANAYISNGLRSTFNSNTLGNLYTTGGNTGLNITNPFSTLHINKNITPTTGGNVNAAFTISHAAGGTSINMGSRDVGIVDQNYSWIQTQYVNLANVTQKLSLNPLGGNIGIGNTNPNYSLDITGITNLRSTQTSQNSTTGALISNGGISIANTSNSTSTTMGGALTIAGGGSIAKDFYVGGTITSSSDARLKINLRPMESILHKIKYIQPINYNSKNESDTKNYIGFIAQSFEEHFPELLYRENENSYYSLAYDRITAINMGAIKELIIENCELKNRLDDIEIKLNNLLKLNNL